MLTHGDSRKGQWASEYRSYQKAKDRCRNEKEAGFAHYGGRGIEFRFTSYEEFLDYMGRKPTQRHSIDRIDNDGHYEKGNVRWATPLEQADHTSRTRLLTVQDGRQFILSEWARRANLTPSTIHNRLHLFGWCVDCAVSLPKFSRCNHKEKSNADN